MKKKYEIAYRHTSPETATSCNEALQMVRMKARQRRIYYVRCPEAIYCYRSLEDRTRDDTGASAYAVISHIEKNKQFSELNR